MAYKKSAAVSSGNLISGTLKVSVGNISQDRINVKPDPDYFLNVYRRFFMQRISQDLLNSRKIIHPQTPYFTCHRSYINSIVSVYRNPESRRGYFQSVATCGNVKSCPVCSPRILGTRSTEIKNAVHKWLNLDSNNTCYLLTLTFSHSAGDRLESLLFAFSESVQRFWRNGSVKRAFCGHGYIGRITSLEVQYSLKHGFHPHQHVLIFCHRGFYNVDALQKHWLHALENSGLTGLSNIALDLIEARSAEDYLTKISSEMALGNLKQGRGTGHYSPLQVLAEVCQGESWAKDVWCEYFQATRGIHSLYWSKHLRGFFFLDDCSDSDIAAGSDLDSLDLFCEFPCEYYRHLSSQFKAHLLSYAACGNYQAASELFKTLGFPMWEKYTGNLL